MKPALISFVLGSFLPLHFVFLFCYGWSGGRLWGSIGSFQVGLRRRAVVSLSRFVSWVGVSARITCSYFGFFCLGRCLQWTTRTFFSLPLFSYVLYISFFLVFVPFYLQAFLPSGFSWFFLFLPSFLFIFACNLSSLLIVTFCSQVCVGSFLLFVQLLS
uniref:Transmembrane protein n=1 Tax=Salix viminalis TaxID=40686 RepID=A0A6N2KCA5_SALVM